MTDLECTQAESLSIYSTGGKTKKKTAAAVHSTIQKMLETVLFSKEFQEECFSSSETIVQFADEKCLNRTHHSKRSR